MKGIVLFGVGCSTLAMSLAVPAMAQSVPAEEAATTSGEIVVTARKRAESAQDVPIALNVASEQDLINRSVVNVTDIQQQTPALRFSQAALNPTGVYFSARGLVVTDTRLTTDPAIGLYIDGVYIPRAVGLGASDMFDVSRIEVLKGPQGTLYGKNNTAGAINIYYNEPTDQFEGKVRVRAAEHREFAGAGVVNLPLSETAGLRVVGQALYRGGYGTNAFNGQDLGKLSSQTLRGTLKLTPTDRFTVTVRGDYLHANATGNAFKGGTNLLGSGLCEVVRSLFNSCTVGAAGPIYSGANPAADQAAALAAFRSYTLGDKDDSSMNVHPFSRTKLWGYSATLDYELSNELTVKSITAVRHVRDHSATDLDGSPFQLLSFDDHIIRDKQFSQEVQLNAELFDSRLNLIVGGYYANEKGYEYSASTSLGLLTAARGAAINEADIRNRTIAGFAQGSFKVTDQLNLTAGIRYTEDKRRMEAYNRNLVTCTALGTNFAVLNEPCTTGELNVKYTATSWTVSVDYKPVDDIMVFIRADRGYRTGGFPLTGGASPVATLTAAQNRAAAAATFAPVAPEFAMSYEAGFKADLFDRMLRVNASFYRVTYSDLQRSSSQTIPGTNPPAVISRLANVAKARINGIEADAMLRPVAGLELGGALSYIDAKYLDYGVAGLDSSGNPVVVDSRALPFVETPKWTYSLTGAYTFPVGTAEVRAQLDYAWQGPTVASIGQALNATRTAIATIVRATRPSNHSLNGRLSVELENGLNVAVFGRNITNNQVGNFPLALDFTLGMHGLGGSNAPRTLGVELTKNF